MKNVCVVTTTRAEYGLLKNVINLIDKSNKLNLILVVTGTHLSEKFGRTISEIYEDGIKINKCIDILSNRNDNIGITETIGNASYLFGEFFSENKIDVLVVCGDRYELLPICLSALCFKIPIAHISGGEVTEGAIDDSVRHSITKMSYLHFPACEKYRRRIIQLGENPNRVFNFGDVGVENVYKISYMTKNELEEALKIKLDGKYMSVTFHPVTLDEVLSEVQFKELLQAIEQFEDIKFIFSKANADAGGEKINTLIDQYVASHKNAFVFDSLGVVKYLSLLKYSCGIIGNSSSGIVEAPSLNIPTINIGDRQRGREQAQSIINCMPKKEEIISAIKYALSEEFTGIVMNSQNPYGLGNTAKNIVDTIEEFLYKDNIELKKSFYDINFGDTL